MAAPLEALFFFLPEFFNQSNFILSICHELNEQYELAEVQPCDSVRADPLMRGLGVYFWLSIARDAQHMSLGI